MPTRTGPASGTGSRSNSREGNLQVKVNGRVVNEATDCEVVAGPIGLQSEGGKIHFRKVRLVPLS